VSSEFNWELSTLQKYIHVWRTLELVKFANPEPTPIFKNAKMQKCKKLKKRVQKARIEGKDAKAPKEVAVTSGVDYSVIMLLLGRPNGQCSYTYIYLISRSFSFNSRVSAEVMLIVNEFAHTPPLQRWLCVHDSSGPCSFE